MTFVDANLRMTVAMTDSIDMSNKSFAVPVSTYETFAGGLPLRGVVRYGR